MPAAIATSGTLEATRFNAVRVVDHAYRRCRLSAQQVTAEMQQYALESLYLLLSEWGNVRAPSWCVEKLVLPMQEGAARVALPVGTVEVLNLNLRVTQPLQGTRTDTPNAITFDLGTPAQPVTVGVLWAGLAVPFTLQASADGVTWADCGAYAGGAAVGERTWTDLTVAAPRRYLRLLASAPLLTTAVTLGSAPQEVPFGQLNRDQYVAQSNKAFLGRPLTYWFQRERKNPVLNLWPAPNTAAAEGAQLVVTRHRHIMDTATLQQDVDVPARWLEAVTARLAARVGAETPQVDPAIIMQLEARAVAAELLAWAGDTDGSPMQIQPAIRAYTK